MIEEINALETERRARLRQADGDPALEQVRALMALRSIGLRSAWLFVMEFFAWRNFKNRREVPWPSGGRPTPTPPAIFREPGQSGASPASRPPPTRVVPEWQGRPLARHRQGRQGPGPHHATEIAWSWIRHQPDSEITRWFNRRFAQAGKGARRRGITAVDRKLLVALWRYLDHGVVPDGALFKDV